MSYRLDLAIVLCIVVLVVVVLWAFVYTTDESGMSWVRPPEALVGAEQATPEQARTETLSFAIHEGSTENRFFRREGIAAHLLATSGERPRVIVAFPAGNSGIGLFLQDRSKLAVAGEVEGVEEAFGQWGIRATVECSATLLRVREAVLGTIRTLKLRYGQEGEELAESFEVKPRVAADATWSRIGVGGGRQYTLRVRPVPPARVDGDAKGDVTFSVPPGHEEPMRLEVTALTNERPLAPIPSGMLLFEPRDGDRIALFALAFLSYEEKLLAGSWRSLTFFGRDTLLSLRMLMSSLRPEVVEAGLGSVLERLGPTGQVAHEEETGEWAAIRRRLDSPGTEDGAPDAATCDYGMVDDDFLLAPVVARYLLDTPEGRRRASAFLARTTTSGVSHAEALVRNLGLVVRWARPYAEAPRATNLVGLLQGREAGNWRDSRQGIGGGRFAFDVNGVLVPAALEAAARLYESPFLGEKRHGAEEARGLARAWAAARAHFRVEVPPGEARARVRAYAGELGIPADPAVSSIDGPVVFPALALSASGEPVPVMSSDEGFTLLFLEPEAAELERIAARIFRPFPAGLLTPIGVVVANSAFVLDDELRTTFSPTHYHGAVFWSWQQAMLAAGLRRQMHRKDLPEGTLAALRRAEALLWAAIRGGGALRTSELYTWRWDGSRFEPTAFGQAAIPGGGTQGAESNAVQLLGTVYLAIPPP